MTRGEQLDFWLKGISIHENTGNQCVPDFSCCHRILKAPQKIRTEYHNAICNRDEPTIEFYDKKFLNKLVHRKNP